MMISAELIAQLEQRDQTQVVLGLARLEGQELDAVSLLILATICGRWQGNCSGNYGHLYCYLPSPIVFQNLTVVQNIMTLLDAHLPRAELPESPKTLVEGCFLLSRCVYPSTETHGEFRYPEIHPAQFEFYLRHELFFDQALHHSPTMQEEFVLLAQIIWSHWRMPQAGMLLEKARELLPQRALHYLLDSRTQNNSATWYCWAEHQRYSTGNLEQALLGYRHFLQLEPNFVPFANFATEEYSINTRNLPASSVQAWAEIGQILWLQNHPREAQTAFENAIQLAPNSQQAPYPRLVKLLEATGQNPETAFGELWEMCQQHGKNHLETKQQIALEWRVSATDWLHQKTQALWQQKDKTALHFCKQTIGQIRALLEEFLLVRPQEKPSEIMVRRDATWTRDELNKLQQNHQQRLLELQLLQAEMALELYNDIWQARALYQRIDHPKAKQKLAELAKIKSV